MKKRFEQKYFLALWLFNPFLSCLYLFNRFRITQNILPFLLVSFFIGSSFIIQLESNNDSVRYVKEFERYFDEQESLSIVLSRAYNIGGKTLDLYQPLVTWIVSRFTDNYKILYGIFGLVFGYFWFSTLKLVSEFMPPKKTRLIIVLFVFLALINPIWNINGVRMWTAAQVFIFGLLSYYLKQNNKGLIFVFSSLFFHFSLALPVFIWFTFTLLLHFLPKIFSLQVAFFIYVACFFFGQISASELNDLFSYLPEFLQQKKSYLNEDYVEKVSKSKTNFNWYINWSQDLKVYIIVFFNFLLFNKMRAKDLMNNEKTKIVTLILLFSAFFVLIKEVPSGRRFLVISDSLTVSILISYGLYVVRNSSLLIAFLLFVIAITIRLGLDFFGFSLFIGNPITSFLFINEAPIIDFIKKLL